ncbi:MAG: hypothetical protein ACMVO3_01820 [Thalassobaculum sp.]
MQPRQDDTANGGDQQRRPVQPGLVETDARVDPVPHHAVGDFDGEGQRHAEREQRRRHKGQRDPAEGPGLAGLVLGETGPREQDEADDQRAGDVDDAEVPRFHREGGEKWDVDKTAGHRRNRDAVQREDMEGGVEGAQGRYDNGAAPLEDATVRLNRLLVDAGGYDPIVFSLGTRSLGGLLAHDPVPPYVRLKRERRTETVDRALGSAVHRCFIVEFVR